MEERWRRWEVEREKGRRGRGTWNSLCVHVHVVTCVSLGCICATDSCICASVCVTVLLWEGVQCVQCECVKGVVL